MKNLSVRANTRQSRNFGSSPGVYFRYSANSTLAPRVAERCKPVTEPSIGLRTFRISRDRRPITSWSRKFIFGELSAMVSGAGRLATGFLYHVPDGCRAVLAFH